MDLMPNNPIAYHFDERLKMSQGISENVSIITILLEQIPGAVNAHAAHEKNDRNGVDFWVEHASGKHIGIDCKVREEDWALRGHDDVALETFSVVEKNIHGWTLNDSKRTDYILWFWKETGRWMLVPFPMLCAVFTKNMGKWKSIYKTARQKTPRFNGQAYHSECVFVPRRELWAAIYQEFSGDPKFS
jgi:hypothetical protein